MLAAADSYLLFIQEHIIALLFLVGAFCFVAVVLATVIKGGVPTGGTLILLLNFVMAGASILGKVVYKPDGGVEIEIIRKQVQVVQSELDEKIRPEIKSIRDDVNISKVEAQSLAKRTDLIFAHAQETNSTLNTLVDTMKPSPTLPENDLRRIRNQVGDMQKALELPK